MIGLHFIVFSACVTLIVVALAGKQGTVISEIHGTKIVGGFPINITDAPYQVVVQLGGSMVCGGAIITSTYIATAAHCLLMTTISYTVKAGATDHEMEGSLHKVINITVHPNYDDILYDYDVAMFEVDPPIEFDDSRQPITIADEVFENGNVTITGWGTSAIDGPTSRILQAVIVPAFSYEKCNESYSEFGGITERMFCAGYEGHDSCVGDSGGPVVADGKLLGIVSWANGCALKGYPGVNTNFAEGGIHQFIKDIVGF